MSNIEQYGGLRLKGEIRTFLDRIPLVSVITVVFNAGDRLEQTILSVLNNKHSNNLEYIIVDGGSTYETLNIIKKYGNRIDYWVSEKDRGLYDAMNKGWNLSRGKYVYYLNAGDILVNLPAYALNCENDVIYGDVITHKGKLFISKSYFFSLLGNTFHHQGLFVKRELAEKSPFDLKFLIYADFDFNLRLILRKVKFFRVPAIISHIEPAGVSSRLNKNEYFKIINKNLGFIYVFISFLYFLLRPFYFFMRSNIWPIIHKSIKGRNRKW